LDLKSDAKGECVAPQPCACPDCITKLTAGVDLTNVSPTLKSSSFLKKNKILPQPSNGSDALEQKTHNHSSFNPPSYTYSLTPPNIASMATSFLLSSISSKDIPANVLSALGMAMPAQPTNTIPIDPVPTYPKQEFFHPVSCARTQQGLPPRLFVPYRRTHVPLVPCNHNCGIVGFFESWRLKFQVVYHCGHQRYFDIYMLICVW
jgi:hypothetical protein